MARPREFDIDEAIARAVAVFWEKGYDGAALPDLLDGMGIARGSLYKAFGDKKQLYLQALARYDEEAVDSAVRILTAAGRPGAHGRSDGGKRIATLFSAVVDAVKSGDRRGCLMCNAAAGPASEDPDIKEAVARMLGRMTSAFLQALKAGSPRSADNRPPRNLQATARSLTASYIGLQILAKAGEPVEELRRTAGATVAAALDSAS